MLNQCQVMAFVPTRDAARARTFYIDRLGLTLIGEDAFATQLDAHGTPIRLVNAPDFTPLPFTLLGWIVEDLAAEVDELTRRGVVFLRFSWFEQDERAIWSAPGGTRVAWFHDPDGNTLSLSQDTPTYAHPA